MKITYEDKERVKVSSLPVKFQVTDNDLNEIKGSVNGLYDNSGWVEFKDTQDTFASPQNLTAITDNVISINGASTILTHKPLGGENLWANNKIEPINIGDSYMVRFDFSAAILNPFGYVDLKLFIGGTIGNAFESNIVFPKGNDVPHVFSMTFLIYTLGTFKANGGQLLFNPSHTAKIWNKRIIITKVHHNGN
jgi:hypothetical protein